MLSFEYKCVILVFNNLKGIIGMDWIEVHPLPNERWECQESDCYNCDYAGKRWMLSTEDALRIRRKGLLKAIARLQKQLKEIDDILYPCSKQE